MQGRRIDRIEEQFRIELSEIIEREIHDPRIGLATVIHVKVSPDLRHARVFVTVLGNDAQRHAACELVAQMSGSAFEARQHRFRRGFARQ